jgi:hypothetical protein
MDPRPYQSPVLFQDSFQDPRFEKQKAWVLVLILSLTTITCDLGNSLSVWPLVSSSVQQEENGPTWCVKISFLLRNARFLFSQWGSKPDITPIALGIKQVPLPRCPCRGPPWIPRGCAPLGFWQPCGPPSPLSTSLPGSELSHWPEHPGTS